MIETQTLEEIIRQRSSIRTYDKRPINEDARLSLERYCSEQRKGPFGNTVRLKLAAAGEGDAETLKGLGTYGFIKNPAGFIIGAVHENGKSLEDFGYVMEDVLLHATSLGLGTCWLGGSFTKSSFARRMEISGGETVPAVVSVGHPTDRRGSLDRVIRWGAGSKHRKPWEELFFSEIKGSPLNPDEAGPLAFMLEMVRLAPSASNRQPWRVLVSGDDVHFFLERTRGYYQRNKRLMNMADLQRVDMGIALCHFEKTAREGGYPGGWLGAEPPAGSNGWEYIVTWKKREK